MIKCRWCGEEFEPAQTAQKYCPKCRSDPEVVRARARKRKRQQLERRRVEKYHSPVFENQFKKTCPLCGREFNPASNRQKWCFMHRKQGRQEARTRYMGKYRAKKRQVTYPSM
ncbi:MAG: hypothetical protein HPY89_00480 [Pelotomaculum sp.]|nr:hypothetical protein [Pelotomaculum sp.]